MQYRTSKEELEKELLELQVQCDILQRRINMREAEENVKQSGISPDDDEYHFEVEQEIDRLWEEGQKWHSRRFEERIYEETA